MCVAEGVFIHSLSLSPAPVRYPVSRLEGCQQRPAAAMATRAGRPPAPAPALLLLLAFPFLLRGVVPSRAGDTVAAGRPLSGAQSLVSKRGKFRLGFFRPGNSVAPN
jgi:hypothetical protein